MPADLDIRAGGTSAAGHSSRSVAYDVAGASVEAAIRAHRFAFGDEDQLQEALAGALTDAGFHVEREVRLSAHDRVDLLVDGRIGVEVKIDGPTGRVVSQLGRYAQHAAIAELVLVTRCARHRAPAGLNGKPITVVNLAGVGL